MPHPTGRVVHRLLLLVVPLVGLTAACGSSSQPTTPSPTKAAAATVVTQSRPPVAVTQASTVPANAGGSSTPATMALLTAGPWQRNVDDFEFDYPAIAGSDTLTFKSDGPASGVVTIRSKSGSADRRFRIVDATHLDIQANDDFATYLVRISTHQLSFVDNHGHGADFYRP